MLNYGYAILYTRVWQALLAARLNPFESIIHARQEGKPTLAFDMRMNYSVFECMLTDIQYKSMCKRLAKIVVRKEDWVNIYPLCTECFARIEYIPPVKKKEPVKIAVV